MLFHPRVGDEVRTTKPTTTLWGHTTRPGAHALVLSVGWTRATIKIATGSGFVTRSVPTSSLRVTRRGVSEVDFTSRARITHLARLGVAVAMLAPFAIFTVRYVLATGGTDGIVETVLVGIAQSAGDLLEFAFTNPIGAGIYLVVGWALWRFAFR